MTSRILPLLFPERRRSIPGSRPVAIAARTLHLAATGILLGGHLFGVPAPRLLPFLWVAIASGALLILVEVAATGHWLHQGAALFVFAKLALLVVVPFAWGLRVPILLTVLLLGSVGSHAPRKIRHYSLRYRRVMGE